MRYRGMWINGGILRMRDWERLWRGLGVYGEAREVKEAGKRSTGRSIARKITLRKKKVTGKKICGWRNGNMKMRL